MFDIRVLGSGREVGRSAIHVSTGSGKYLMDYGIEVQEGKVPIPPQLDLTAVLLSHAHLDHSGLLPELYKRGYAGSVYALPVTFSLSELLLYDSIKVQEKRKLKPHYMVHDIARMMQKRKEVSYGQRLNFGQDMIEFRDAGHVPGSASIMIENSGKKLLYTGDINFVETNLTRGADETTKDVDVLVSESTYTYADHPERSKVMDKLRKLVQETYYGGGTTILPSFAVGRAQELLVSLIDLGVPMVMDGMGIDATEEILGHHDSIKDAKFLQKAFSRARKIGKSRERNEVLERPCVIITTAGMLNGGPVGHYIKNLYMREDCSLMLTGYQVEGTVGRTLMDTGRYKNEGINVKIQNHFEFLDLSAHAGRTQLLKFYKKLNPQKIVLVHGGDNIEAFASELRGMGFDAVAPVNGDKITFK